MFGASVMQHLPQHVLGMIIGHVPAVFPEDFMTDMDTINPSLPFDFLPFMHMCRSWRQAAGPFFYRHTCLCVDQAEHQYHNDYKVATHLVIAANQQRHVKVVYIMMDVSTFAQAWSNDISTIVTIICSCGQLPRVHKVSLGFSEIGSSGDYHRRYIATNASALAQSIRQTMPRVKQVALCYNDLLLEHRTAEIIVNELQQHLPTFVDETATSLTLVNAVVPDHLPAVPLAPLQELTLCETGDTPEAINFVQQYSQSLVKLNIGHISELSAAMLTYNEDGVSVKACVYPRLKHLYISCWTRTREYSHQHPTIDPFPQLEALICHGLFPFAPAVLMGSQSHIGRLEIAIDNELDEIIARHQIFTKGAFKCLRTLVINWESDASSEEEYLRFCQAFELGPTTKSINFKGMVVPNIGRVIPVLQAQSCLRFLDTGYTPLSLEQAVVILCACPGLLEADITLASCAGITDNGCLPPLLIERCRERFRGFRSVVRCLGIKPNTDEQIYAVAGTIVLLGDILGSLACVYVYRQLSNRQLLLLPNLIPSIIQWPIFRDRTHVHNITYRYTSAESLVV